MTRDALRATRQWPARAALMTTFSITTLGCRVNHYESEQLAALLRERGLSPARPGEPADVRVIHTCTVTVQAAGKSRQAVRRSTRLPVLAPTPTDASQPPCEGVTDPVAAVTAVTGLSSSDRSSIRAESAGATRRPRVIVTGCWATSDPKEAAALPGVDAVLGHHQDVGSELTRLLTQWETEEQARGSPTSLVHAHNQPIVPESGSDDGEWMIKKAGTPAGPITPANKPPASSEVNDKLGHDENPCEANHEDQVNRRKSRPDSPTGTVNLPQLGARQTGHQRAFLKVQDGCDAHCTYCIIPQLRPALWSKPVDDAVAEARRLVDAGHVEIVLTGIFLGAYGQPTALRRRQDLKTAGPLAELVAALCTRVPSLRRLRLSSLEPGDLTPDLIATLRQHLQVVPHFHLPLQSGSDAILHRMNRQYGRADYLDMVTQLTDAFDRPAITTDIIVGFPGESEQDFAQTLDIVDQVRFIHVHAFPYSPRPRTAAARWTKQHVRGPVVNERMARLGELAVRHSLAYRQQFVGQSVEVLVERPSAEEREVESMAGYQHGRCGRYFAVHFESDGLLPGTAARVRVDRVTPTRTFGTLLEGAS